MKVAYPTYLRNTKVKGKVVHAPMDIDFCAYYDASALLSPITITLDRDGGWVTDTAPGCDLEALKEQLSHEFKFNCKIVEGKFLAVKSGCSIGSKLPPAALAGKSASQIFPKDPIFHELQMMMHAADYTDANALWIWGKGEEKVDKVVYEDPSEFDECIMLDARVKKYKLWPFF